jgi:hypothetical protein
MFYVELFMNATELLFACLALVMGSIVVEPASAFLGVHCGVTSTLSALSLLGGIVAAFLTVKVEKDSGAE